MILVAVILGVVAVVGIVVALLMMSRLGEQRRLTTAAEARSSDRARELETTSAELAETARQRSAAEERTAVEAARADEAEVAREQARQDAEQATAAKIAAEERASNAERRAADFAAARAAADGGDGGGIDAQLLWTLEQARSERTWRHSVAPGPDSVSVFTDASDPLFEALQVELDAAREEVGAVVEMDVDLPQGVTAAGSVLALRAAQELLAGVVRRGEVTTLHVHADGPDLVVAVRSVDEEGGPVPTEPLAIPASAAVELAPDGVRVLGAVQPIDGAADQTVAGEDGADASDG